MKKAIVRFALALTVIVFAGSTQSVAQFDDPMPFCIPGANCLVQ